MRPYFFMGACFALLLTICTTNAYAQNNRTGNAFTNNGFGNAVANTPGVHHKGVTYISYQGPKEHPWVVSYNHRTKKWAGPYRAGSSILGVGNPTRIDNHGRPSLVVDKEGYIHVFYGGHGGKTELHGENPLGNTHSGEMRHRVTTRPYDISSWRTLDNIPPFGTYTQAAVMDNGDIFFFYRHGAHQSDWVYQRSTDNGLTFEPPVSVLKSERPADRSTKLRRHAWYLNINKTSGNRIDIAFNYHAENRPHDLERRNGYYMYMNTRTRQFRNVKNEVLRMPMRKGNADRNALVVRTPSNKWAHGGKVVLDRNGWPHFTLSEGLDDGTKRGAPKKPKYYRWDGNTKRWLNHSDRLIPVGSVKVAVNAPRNANLIIAEKGGSRGIVRRWVTTNGGKKFSKREVIYDGGRGGVAISDRINDAHPDAQYVILDRHPGTDYVNLILWGDSGIIKRKRSDASVLNQEQKAARPL